MTILKADTECSPAKDDFEVTFKREADRVVLCVRGELDLATAPVLKRCLDAAQSDGNGNISLDLGALTFIDSTGLAVMLECQDQAAAKGASLILRNPGPQAQVLFELAGVRQTLRVEEPESPRGSSADTR